MDRLAEEQSLARWWEEHSELDRLVEAVEETMGGADAAEAARALEQLDEALDAHFTVEEQVYFPLVEEFSPLHSSVVRAASLGHTKIRERMHALRALVENGEIGPARRALFVLLDRFRTHETEERKLILELEALADKPGER
jgi:iron-sulfur cluster repair protein YtfE (RIC family)